MTSRHRLPPSRSRLDLVLVLAAFVAVAAPAAAERDAVQSPVGERALALISEGDGYALVDGAGRQEAVPAPTGTRLVAIVETNGGWLAGGDRWSADGRDLVLIRKAGEVADRVDAPAGRFGFRGAPVLFVENGVLIAMAWLEGDGGEQNAVMAARWRGDGWGSVETVSPLNESGQLAPSGAVLEDGSLLLVWAAVEGEDEEILWSRSGGDGWSPPEIVHSDNDVPDILPRVAAAGSGALIAWSQDDGSDYRLRVWRFDGTSWLDTGFSGEEGSVRPSFFSAPARVGIVYEVANPRSWVFVEFGSDGRLVRRAAVEREGRERRPIVVSDTSSELLIHRMVEKIPGRSIPGEEERDLTVVVEGLQWVEGP